MLIDIFSNVYVNVIVKSTKRKVVETMFLRERTNCTPTI